MGSEMCIKRQFLDIPLSGIPQAYHRPPRSDPDPRRYIYGEIPKDSSAKPPDVPPSKTPVDTLLPKRVLKGPESIRDLRPGDLFLATIPFNGSEPVSLLEFICYDIPTQSDATQDTPVVARWMGHHPHEHYIDTRFYKQRWQPGWYQPNTGEFYFQSNPIHVSHPPFTNVISMDKLLQSDVFLFGFELQRQKANTLRLPNEVVQQALVKYRTMHIPRITEKGPGNLKTSESGESDPDAS